MRIKEKMISFVSKWFIFAALTAYNTYARFYETATDTYSQTPGPTYTPTSGPTSKPTKRPTSAPTKSPTSAPTSAPTSNPTSNPTYRPTTPGLTYDQSYDTTQIASRAHRYNTKYWQGTNQLNDVRNQGAYSAHPTIHGERYNQEYDIRQGVTYDAFPTSHHGSSYDQSSSFDFADDQSFTTTMSPDVNVHIHHQLYDYKPSFATPQSQTMNLKLRPVIQTSQNIQSKTHSSAVRVIFDRNAKRIDKISDDLVVVPEDWASAVSIKQTNKFADVIIEIDDHHELSILA